ncbi:hypothetical protein CVCC1112_1335 [Paenarthrobacter nicotinovorans]|nr:hypothetical protein CVCC1112_1335 [Paenarthrobacter nicotinovorans]
MTRPGLEILTSRGPLGPGTVTVVASLAMGTSYPVKVRRVSTLCLMPEGVFRDGLFSCRSGR